MAEDYEFKRVRYFDRQFLREQDFNLDTAYHLHDRRDHARLLHTPGIAEGLEVESVVADPGKIRITAGCAYDELGRRIRLAADLIEDLSDQPDNAAVYVKLAWADVKSDTSDEGGVSSETRWTETPAIMVGVTDVTDPQPVPDAARTSDPRPARLLLLARVVRSGRTVVSVDGSMRRRAGAAAGSVSAAALADKAVTSAKLAEADGATGQNVDMGSGVKTGHLQDAAVTTEKLALAAVTSDRLAAGSVMASHIAAGNVDTSALADNAVTLDKLADGAVDNAKIVDGVVTADKLADEAVTSAKIAEASLIVRPGSNSQDTNSGTGIKTGHLQNGAVTTPKLADAAVTAAKIADGNVGTAELADGAVTAAKLADRSISGAKLVQDLEVSGRIGIGTPPVFALDVLGRMRVRQGASGNPSAGIWLSGYYRQEFDAAFVGMETENSAGFWGNVGAPGWRLTVGLDTGNLAIAGNAFKPGGGAWGTSSDERLKQDIAPLSGALERLLQLRPISFEWKEPATQGNLTGAQMGFLAQEVETVFPQWVGVDGQGYKTLTIRGFEALAVEALKELESENEQLRATLADLRQKVEALEKRWRG